ncbi:MAG: transposase [Clostridia bacterium]|nr:transposase [Clostridia bacterium]
MSLPKRKPTRLKDYDYSSDGAYFVTICTKEKQKMLCDIVGDGAHDVPKINLSQIGEIVEKYILSTNKIPELTVDKYVIMPNHIHMILLLQNQNGTSRAPSPTNNIISRAISTFKRFVHKDVGYNVF